MKKISKIWYVAGALIIVALATWLLSGNKKDLQIQFSKEKAQKTNIQNSVTATGTIEPVTSVTVGTQVSGIVSRLFVDYNSVVKKGQVIAELDKTNLISELNTAKANLSSAQSSLKYETENYKRYKTLFDKGLVSADEYENARLSYDKALQTVNTSKESVQKAQTAKPLILQRILLQLIPKLPLKQLSPQKKMLSLLKTSSLMRQSKLKVLPSRVNAKLDSSTLLLINALRKTLSLYQRKPH